VSWRGCIDDGGNPWVVNALGCTLCRVVLCLFAGLYVWLYALSFSSTPCRVVDWRYNLLFGPWLLFGPRLAVLVVV